MQITITCACCPGHWRGRRGTGVRRSAWEVGRGPLGRELCFCAFSSAPSTPSAAGQGRSTSPARCACGANKAQAAPTDSGRCARQGSPAAQTGCCLRFKEASGPATPQATFRFAKTAHLSPFCCWPGAAALQISASRGLFLRESDCLDAGKSGRDLPWSI